MAGEMESDPIDLEGFVENTWLKEKLAEIETLQPGEVREFEIPPEINYLYFIAKLGEPRREFEYGGVINPKTGSVKMSRGFAPGQRGANSTAGTKFISPRLNPDGRSTDDILFHTHPWQEKSPISFFNEPKNSCRPIGTDIDNVMNLKNIEAEDGFDRTVTSVIGSRGYISITEASGVNFDPRTLRRAGVSEAIVEKIGQDLNILPPVWVKNYALSETNVEGLLELVNNFYSHRFDSGSSFREKIEQFRHDLSGLIETDRIDRFIKNLLMISPKYLDVSSLVSQGLKSDQAEIAHQMFGVSISLFRIIDGVGMEKLKT